MKYFAVYKCPLCNKLMRFGDSIEISYNKLPEVLGAVISNQRFLGHPVLHKVPMQIPCKCADGNAGLAQFAGLVKDDSCGYESKAIREMLD